MGQGRGASLLTRFPLTWQIGMDVIGIRALRSRPSRSLPSRVFLPANPGQSLRGGVDHAGTHTSTGRRNAGGTLGELAY